MKKIIFLLALMISQCVFSAEDKIVFVVEQRTIVGLENMGFVLEGDKITATSNTNMTSEDYPYYFGLFEAKASPDFKKEILELSSKKIAKSNGNIYESPHDMKVYMNGEQVPSDTDMYTDIINLIKAAFKENNLFLKGGVIIKSKADAAKVECEEDKENICTFQYGYLHR
jgi:hypothetical protein